MTGPDHEVIEVLLVDDHRAFAESLARLLADEPDLHVVGVVTTGADAQRAVAQLKPRVVLVDYQLPDRDGVTVAAQIKRQAPDTMVVMLTGSTDDRLLLGAIEAGCSGFLTKDRPASEIVEAVRTVARGDALISPAMLARLLPKLNRARRAPGWNLTDRELDILARLAQGASNKAIATELSLSVNTIRNYVQSILRKLDAHSKLEAVAAAVREGIVDYQPGRS